MRNVVARCLQHCSTDFLSTLQDDTQHCCQHWIWSIIDGLIYWACCSSAGFSPGSGPAHIFFRKTARMQMMSEETYTAKLWFPALIYQENTLISNLELFRYVSCNKRKKETTKFRVVSHIIPFFFVNICNQFNKLTKFIFLSATKMKKKQLLRCLKSLLLLT